ncbi:circadian clock KaiB family protein [Thiocapsa bogorovii]|uniref:circadian clock KaiB family protein n=1 Tax=Thiocapsa bogorovii TaxID=521689 RepID=UPI001E2CF4B4|nr:circadian clock KaiB family protein [Thiocapsa bogorovii]UHD15151.1 circadian clock KaiB family protein [Thiocapsa bogorovii]
MTSEAKTESLFVVQLFIAGDSEQTKAVRDRVIRFAEAALMKPHRVEIIDVLANPDVADIARILVTPTLVIRAPNTERRLVGDLSDVAKLQLVLTEDGLD